jgi:hypothetical protein
MFALHFLHVLLAHGVLLCVKMPLVRPPTIRVNSPDGSRVPFFEFFHHGGRADVQHACRIAHATGIEGHINDLLLHRRRLTGAGICQQKDPPTPLTACPTPIPLLAFSRQTMSHDIGSVTVWTMQHLGNPASLPQNWWHSSSTEDTRSTALKHLSVMQGYTV